MLNVLKGTRISGTKVRHMIDRKLRQDVSTFLLHIIDSDNATEEQKRAAAEIDERVVREITETAPNDEAKGVAEE